MKTETKDLEPISSGFLALKDASSMADALSECEGLDFTLDRVKWPGAGATAFELPGDDEDGELTKELRGVIVYHHPAFSYYREKYSGGNQPPDCGSFDGKVGIGCPGGRCTDCYYNRFGSGEGNSKACKNRRLVYLLQEGELFPVMLSVPTGSLREFSQSAKRQLSRGRKLSDIITRITLKKATSTSGIVFSQAVFTMERVLSPEERSAIAHVIADAKAYAQHLSMAALTPVEEAADNGEEMKPLA